MLLADKQNLEMSYRLRMLHIREKELDFYMKNTSNIANLAVLLTCFAYSGLTQPTQTKMVDHDICGSAENKEAFCAEILWPISITCTIFLSMLTLWGCMLVTMLAPRLALLGPDGSLSHVVDLVCTTLRFALSLSGAPTKPVPITIPGTLTS